eukprot:768107-Hanusia_phi.AAC.1
MAKWRGGRREEKEEGGGRRKQREEGGESGGRRALLSSGCWTSRTYRTTCGCVSTRTRDRVCFR